MAIITVSRGSYSNGKEIAEKVAKRLGYQCISRDILLEASEHFNIPEVKLVRALHDAPSFLDRFSNGKARYIAYFREALLVHIQGDNVVYHGLAGHFFVKDISHVMNVRIIADLDARVQLEMKRENLSEEKARYIIEKDDYERRKWSLKLYGMDTADPRLYDLILHIQKITVDDAVDILCHSAALPHFKTTDESQRTLDNLVLTARVESAIIFKWPKVQVSADDGKVVIHTEAPMVQASEISKQISPLIDKIPGVKEVDVQVRPTTFMGVF
jgi:cytidylate kinase